MILDDPCASGEKSERDTASLASTVVTSDVETQTEGQEWTPKRKLKNLTTFWMLGQADTMHWLNV